MSELIEKGKIRHAGASNLDAGQLTAALKIASQKSLPRYEVLQPEYNLYDRSSFDGPLPTSASWRRSASSPISAWPKGFSAASTAARPISAKARAASGVGKYLNARGFRILAALDAVSARHSAKPAEVALAWVIARPGVTAPIASATTLPQMESLIRAASLKLSASDLAKLGHSQRTVGGASHFDAEFLSRLTAVGGKAAGLGSGPRRSAARRRPPRSRPPAAP